MDLSLDGQYKAVTEILQLRKCSSSRAPQLQEVQRTLRHLLEIKEMMLKGNSVDEDAVDDDDPVDQTDLAADKFVGILMR